MILDIPHGTNPVPKPPEQPIRIGRERADGGALTRKPGVLDTPTSSTLTTMSLLVPAAST